MPPDLLNTLLATTSVAVPFVYYDFSAHPPFVQPVPFIVAENPLPQIYSQKPVGAIQDTGGPPAYIKGPELLSPNLLSTLLAVTTTAPFVYYDFSAHPPVIRVIEFFVPNNALPQIYTQSPVGAIRIDDAHPIIRPGQPERWKGFFDLSLLFGPPVGATKIDDAHPIIRPGQPERWKSFFDLSQVYAQAPVGSVKIDDAHPIIRPGQPERWKAFSDLALVYAQKPIGLAQLSFDTPPPVRPGQPERWRGFFDLTQVYGQTPTGASSLGFFNFPPPIIRASAEWLTPDLLATLLTATPPTIPFIFYDFAIHPSNASYRMTAEIPTFPNLALPYAPPPVILKAIEWILRARRRHNR
jgi:hypothetical protein